MNLLNEKKLLITGVLTDDSIAYGVAKLALEEGAEIVLTGAGRALSLTRRTAKKLSADISVYELDVTQPQQAVDLNNILSKRWDRIDGILHAIGYAPPNCLGNGILKANWEEVGTALQISTYSYKLLAEAFLELLKMSPSPSIVGLDFDASSAWPTYDWMGVAKAGLESLNRYLAKDLGEFNIRVNLVAAGPIRTVAAKSIPEFSKFDDAWSSRSPLKWSTKEHIAVAKACILFFSDYLPLTTGEILHVDGGFHCVGA
jgi:enoyl-[acyl-carrier protein] reductase I